VHNPESQEPPAVSHPCVIKRELRRIKTNAMVFSVKRLKKTQKLQARLSRKPPKIFCVIHCKIFYTAQPEVNFKEGILRTLIGVVP
jgi:hypothetical protein